MRYNYLGNTDMQVSVVGLGGASFSSIYGPFDEAQSIALIRETLGRGVNYLETGPWYGQGTSEITFGKALEGIPRENYYIASKVGRYELDVANMFDFSAEKTAAAVDSTLNRLGVDYVDIIQIHDPTFAPDMRVILKETLPTLEKAVMDGKARHIGLADYDLEVLREIIEESDVRISTVMSYAKSTMFDNRLQNYTGYFANKGVGVINAATTGMGLLTHFGPQPWHPAPDLVKEACTKATQFCAGHDVDLARLATWFSFQQPDIATHVCGFSNLHQMMTTMDIEEHGLYPHEMGVLQEVQARFFDNRILNWDNVELPKYKARMNAINGLDVT